MTAREGHGESFMLDIIGYVFLGLVAITSLLALATLALGGVRWATTFLVVAVSFSVAAAIACSLLVVAPFLAMKYADRPLVSGAYVVLSLASWLQLIVIVRAWRRSKETNVRSRSDWPAPKNRIIRLHETIYGPGT